MQYIEIREEFPFSVDKLFSYLEKHENLNTIFVPMKIKTIKEGSKEKYGVGSVRSLQIAIEPPIEETITLSNRNERIEYKITKGDLLKNHLGVMRFSSTANGSALHYTIEFDSSIPFIATIVKFALERGIKNGLKKLKATPL